MGWQHYRLVFRLRSPLHIGYRKSGNLMETRRYVPGKNLWAALTARLTRDYHNGSRGSEYRRIGDLVREHFRFGYLWPSLDSELPCFPWGDEDFDYLFLGGLSSTALEHDQRAAQDGTLHDVEFIAPMTRTRKPVHLIGDLWVRDGLPADVSSWEESLRSLALGGEQGYGWGRVQMEGGPCQSPKERALGNLEWEANDEVVITVPADGCITAHALAAGDNAVTGIIGPVEPLVGWERRESGGYGLTRQVDVAYAPGAVVSEEIRVRVGEYGVWEATVDDA